MSAFDKVIGYDNIKEQIFKIIDMVKNREIYNELGAKLPSGILLSGKPGLGKTLIANCFIDEVELPSFMVRRDKSDENFIGQIKKTFEKAKLNAPSVVLLDDMDKYANIDYRHKDAPEFIAVQSGIDSVSDSDVIVLATVNDIDKLPESLVRSGRFDYRFTIEEPTGEDAAKIIRYFLSSRKMTEDINIEDLYRMVSNMTCAEIETVINKATMYAGMRRKTHAEMNDLVQVVREEYFDFDNGNQNARIDVKKVALHEAAHAVVSEVLCQGSVGMVAIKKIGDKSPGGFVHTCGTDGDISSLILISLASKAAMDLYYGDSQNYGVVSDLRKAHVMVKDSILQSAKYGFSYYGADPIRFDLSSEQRIAVSTELERYYNQARMILIKNCDFLDAVTDALLKRETLLYSDIQSIKNRLNITHESSGRFV